MSEDSIASDSISCRTEVCAPLLPPRKRLLAGLKQNGWCSLSSPSCGIPPVEDHQITETLAQTAVPKREECNEAEESASLQCIPCPATESANSHQKSQRKSKRQGTSLKEKSSKEQRFSSGPKHPPLVEESKSSFVTKLVADANSSSGNKRSPVIEEANSSFVTKLVTANLVTDVKDSFVLGKVKDEEGSREAAIGARHTTVNVKEADAGVESGEPNVHLAGVLDPGSIAIEHLRSEEVRNSSGKPEDEGDSVALKPRKGSNRQEQSRNKAGQQKKQDLRHVRSSQVPPFLSDEEFARQLHRMMNSSPRISRCQSLKEEKLLVAANQKHYPGG